MLAALKPIIFSLKNRIKRRGIGNSSISSDLMIVFFTVLIMGGIFISLAAGLSRAKGSYELAYLPPSAIYDIFLMFLFCLLLFSNVVSAIGSLLTSDDLEILMSSPIRKWNLFICKIFEVSLTSTWMVVMFGAPVVLAFGVVYEQEIYYYIMSAVILIPYFIIPAAIAVILAVVLGNIFPANRAKEIGFGIFITLGVGLILTYSLTQSKLPQGKEAFDEILYLVRLIQLPNSLYLPSHWAARAIGGIIEGNYDYMPYLIALIGGAISLLSLGYILFSLLHQRAYSLARSVGTTVNKTSYLRNVVFDLMFPLTSRRMRAIMAKDSALFARDMAQALQLALLLVLCIVYLYNLKVLRVVQELPEESRLWWEWILISLNVGMGSFVMAAMCTRFVYTSVSLEGRAYWIIKSAPISLYEFLRSKFLSWYLTTSSIGTIIFMSGALAIFADPLVVIISGLCSWLICYGLVGLALGFGSVYARFDWRHSSELSANFGSLLYMLSAIIFIAINLSAGMILLGIRNLMKTGVQIDNGRWFAIIATVLIFTAYLNWLTATWSIAIGKESLARRDN